MEKKKKTICDFQEMKKRGEKITFLTCYDFYTAQCCEEAKLDMLLVGDSLLMCVYGFKNTVEIPTGMDVMQTMINHTEAVHRGAPHTFIIGDMPFLSYQVSVDEAIRNAGRFFREAGVDAIKLEGGERVIDKVKGIRRAGMGVVGHVGFTPQSSDIKRKSPKVNGRTAKEAEGLLKDALALQEAGVFAILLEAIPPEVGQIINKACKIPVLGIGAGMYTGGQLLISHDVLGLFTAFNPKFVKKYLDGHGLIVEALERYVADIRERRFPEKKHCYGMLQPEQGKPGELEKLQEKLARPSSWLMGSGKRAEVNKAIEEVIKESKKT